MAFAVRSADALTTPKILYNQLFCTFDPPQEILTDRGSHFANAMITNLCQRVKVKHKFSTPYHPQTKGLVEKFNGTLVQILRKLSVNYPTHWGEWVNTALYCYRTVGLVFLTASHKQ
jgi:transposase InsO family protein